MVVVFGWAVLGVVCFFVFVLSLVGLIFGCFGWCSSMFIVWFVGCLRLRFG